MSRVVVVTGATRGIGREVARQLAVRGDQVVLGARRAAAGRRTAAELATGGAAVDPRELDVADPVSVARFATDVERCYPCVDVLVNNAAVNYDTGQRASTADLDEIRRTLDTNLFGAWQVTLAMLPLLRASQAPRIVNVSSEGGSLTSMGGGTPAYAVSKTALNALTRMLATELRSDGILVNSVCPGWVATDMGGAGGRPVSDGAASVVWAADLPSSGPSGGFFRDGRPLPW
jgi:NAD(P)-dependent dehydrogenase (short-subunit alcohol dehydrogenase family)